MEYGIFLMFLNLGKLLLLDRHQVWRSHDPTSVYTFDFCEKKKVITLPSFIQIAKRFDSLNEQMPPTNDHFKRHSITYE